MLKNKKVITSTIEMGRPTNTIETPQVIVGSARTNFIPIQKKVRKRRGIPIGENIRDAIKSIKGRKLNEQKD